LKARGQKGVGLKKNDIPSNLTTLAGKIYSSREYIPDLGTVVGTDQGTMVEKISSDLGTKVGKICHNPKRSIILKSVLSSHGIYDTSL
jgi:hypothetical protein